MAKQTPDGWAQSKLGEIVERVQYGATASAKKTGKLKLLRITDITDTGVNWDKVPFCDLSLSEGDKYTLLDGDVLIARTGGTVGKSFRVVDPPRNVIFASYLIRLCPKDEFRRSRYVELFLRSPLYWRAIREGAKGAAQPNVNSETLKNIKIPLPPLAEQTRIIIKIETAQEKIKAIESKLVQIDELIGKYSESILQKGFRGQLVPQDPSDEPASNLIKRIQADRISENIKAKKEALPIIKLEEIPFEIPKSWEWVRMGDISDVVRGGSPRPAGDKRFYDGNIPFLHVSDLTREPTINVTKFAYTIKPAGLIKTRQVEANTLLITNSGATLGVPRIVRFQTTFNDGVAAFLNISTSISKEFLCYYLSTLTAQLLKSAYGSRSQGQPNLNTNLIANIIVPIPPVSEQQAIVSKFEKMQAEINRLKNMSRELNALRQKLSTAIFEKAFSGGLVHQDPAEGTRTDLFNIVSQVVEVKSDDNFSRKEPRKKRAKK